jgi:hypothetical protein
MTRRHGVRARAVLAVLLLLPIAPVRAAPPAPNAKALARAEATLIDAAIMDLRKEYAAHLKDPATNSLRPQSNYFTEHPVQLSTDSVLDALERPVSDDPRCAAYVKWQLLSGAPEKFEAAFHARALKAYENAPPPPPRFGSTQDDRLKLDALLLKARKDEDAAISAKLEERVRRETEENRPILLYRDALYAKLPEGYDTIVAGFRDAHDRTQAAAGGGSSDEHAARVVKDALAWAQSGNADPNQCAALAELVARLRFVRSPPYYARAAWRYDHLAWSSKTDAVYSAKKLSDLENVLREEQKLASAQQSAQPAGQRGSRATNRKQR